MLLTLTTTHSPATDLGFLLHKNPARIHELDLAFGRALVFFPEATEERCTAALLLELDPIRLSRRRASEPSLEPYVNDRPYVTSSFLSGALAEAFSTAFGGRSKERPELAATAIPLAADLPVVPCRGGQDLLHRLFEPLGYRVGAERLPLDPSFPEWGDSPYYHLRLEATCRLQDLLRHLYLLIPVLDDRKHYWVGEGEIEKLVERGRDWLPSHPERELILARALRHRKSLTRLALERLLGEDAPVDERQAERDAIERNLEHGLRLNDQRYAAVRDELVRLGARRVLDLGCGEGRLLRLLLRERQFEHLVGVDASLRAIEIAHERLGLAEASPKLRERVALLHGALTYRDRRLEGFDAAVLVEVVEHLDRPRLSALERVVFGLARPGSVVVTTPNRDYNALFENLAEGKFRHPDHRFEWNRAELAEWAESVATQHGYTVRFGGIGEEHPELGSPTQLAVFEQCP